MGNTTQTVKSKTLDGKEITVFVKKPSYKELEDSEYVALETFRRALEKGALTREKIDDYMRKEGLWNDDKQKELERLTKIIIDGERQLARGGRTKDGKKFSKDDAKQLAINIRRARFDQTMLLAKQRELDQFTVQGRSENAKFNYLVSVCTRDEEGNPVFADVDDYLSKGDEPYAIAAASELGNIYYGLDPEYEKNRVENKFLVQYGFARESDMRLVNKDGDLVDVDNNLVNEDGRYVDKDGNFIDKQGNRVDKNGNPVEDFIPFDDDVVAEAVEEKEEDVEEDAEVVSSK